MIDFILVLFFQNRITYTKVFQFFNERCGDCNLELSRQKIDIPLLYRVKKLHCQRNISFVVFYHLYKIISKFRREL